MKRFGLEGAESLVPGLQAFVERAAERGVESIVIGMAHREGSTFAQRPLENLWVRFALKSWTTDLLFRRRRAISSRRAYSGGRRGRRRPEARQVALSLVPNPSHLEMVNAVVTAWCEAQQFRRDPDGKGEAARSRVLPLLLHGDASFCGLGQNAEVMQLQDLPINDGRNSARRGE